MKDLKDLLNNSINEGAWGYAPNASDSAMDLIDSLKDEYVDYPSKFIKMVKDTPSAYDFIALVEWWAKGLEPLGVYLNDNKIKNYVKAYQNAVKKCLADKKWLDTWGDPNAVRMELYTRDDVVKSIDQIIRMGEIMTNVRY